MKSPRTQLQATGPPVSPPCITRLTPGCTPDPVASIFQTFEILPVPCLYSSVPTASHFTCGKESCQDIISVSTLPPRGLTPGHI